MSPARSGRVGRPGRAGAGTAARAAAAGADVTSAADRSGLLAAEWGPVAGRVLLALVLAWFGAIALPNAAYLTGRDFTDGKLAAEGAVADLRALAEGLAAMAAAVKGKSFGPTPLAARFT